MKWLTANLGLLLTIALNLIGIGALYGTMSSQLKHNATRIEALEHQRGDETRWRVGEHEKRLDQHDQLLVRISDKLNTLTILAERIDQKLQGKQ